MALDSSGVRSIPRTTRLARPWIARVCARGSGIALDSVILPLTDWSVIGRFPSVCYLDPFRIVIG